MTTGEQTFNFEALAGVIIKISVIGEDRTALEDVEKGLRQLERKYNQYAKYTATVVRVNSQMQKEIKVLNATILNNENKIVSAKTFQEQLQYNNFNLVWREFDSASMATNEKTICFEAINSVRKGINLICKDPTALENVKKDVGQLEKKYQQYAKYMETVLRVHSQMKTEIKQLNETIKQEHEIVSAKTDSKKANKLTCKLKREKLCLKQRRRKCKVLHHMFTPSVKRKGVNFLKDVIPRCLNKNLY